MVLVKFGQFNLYWTKTDKTWNDTLLDHAGSNGEEIT